MKYNNEKYLQQKPKGKKVFAAIYFSQGECDAVIKARLTGSDLDKQGKGCRIQRIVSAIKPISLTVFNDICRGKK